MIELRPYQKRFVREVHAGIRESRRVCAVAPTGAGKRIQMAWWCTQIVQKGRRVLVTTDRRILIDQMADELKSHGIPYGILMGSEARNDDAPVQICSIQTLKRRQWKDLPSDIAWILIDEAHKTSADYQTLADLYPTAVVCGLTATPVGASGTSLVGTGLFTRIVEPVKNTELIDAGYLLRTKVLSPSEPNVKGVSLSNGEYNQQQLGQRVEECTVFADVFEWYERYCDRQTLCFAPRVVYARGIADQFRRRGIKSAIIEAGTVRDERRTILDDFGAGRVRVLVAVDVLREGFDCPVAGLGIDLQPTKQFRVYWQKLGRVKRPHGDQEHAVWLDFAGNYWRFPHPDEDPQWPQWYSDETTQDVIERKREKGEAKEPWCCPQCSMTVAFWQQVKGGACPNCGAPIGKPIRRIRMEDGSMRTVSAKEKKKKLQDQDTQLWMKLLFQAGYTNNSMAQVRARYMHIKRASPRPDFPFMLKADPGDYAWTKKVFELYPQLDKRRR